MARVLLGSIARCTGVLLGIGGLPALAGDSAVDGLRKMVAQGEVEFDFRYRYEFVDQDGFDRDAAASTLRSRLTYGSGQLRGISFLAEFDNVTSIGSERYNSTENGKADYPVVADPTGTDFNQVLIKYKIDDFAGTYGRQRILHSGQRFIGGVAFRQNEQTYDGVRVQWNVGEALQLDYSYIYGVNRIFGPDDGANPARLHGSNHFLFASYALADGHSVAAFAYLLDFDSQRDYGSAKTVDNSSNTFGLEYSGNFKPLKLYATYASQSDAGDNTRSYDADYYKVDAGLALAAVTLTAGWEVLGAGDGVGFATPLATLHKFQGGADVFLNTPPDGIEDVYVGVSGKMGQLKLQAMYHHFSAEDSSDDYGTEFNLSVSWALNKSVFTQLSFADYDADDFAADTRKAWLTVQLKI